MKFKLYYTPRTRSTRVRWLLEELEQDYALEFVDLFNGGGNTDEYRKIHPLGCVPALEVDGEVMFESGAICEWLADQFPEKQLAPPVNDRLRMQYNQWLHFIVATLEPQAWSIVLHSKILPEAQRVEAIVPWAEQKYREALAVIEQHLQDKQFMVGDRFTTVDLMLSYLLNWFPRVLKAYPNAAAYTKLHLQREKYLACQQ